MIALDAMGGDFFPKVPIQAAIKYTKNHNTPILLLGKQSLLEQELAKYTYDKKLITIFDCPQQVNMQDSVIDALRKKESSLHHAFYLHKENKVQGVVSAGNSGAILAIGKYILRSIEGIDRPCISAVLPHINGKFVFLDVGANINCKAKDLLQFSVLGSIYAKEFLNIENPRVSLLNIGEEKGKGNSLLKQSYSLLEKANLNFVGNIEGKEIFLGKTDVVVTDGILGNTFLKAVEGTALFVQNTIKRQFTSSLTSKLGALFLKKDFQAIKKKIDYAEYGGAPLLGLNGVGVIAHGSSRDDALVFAMRFAKWAADCQYVDQVKNKIKELSL